MPLREFLKQRSLLSLLLASTGYSLLFTLLSFTNHSSFRTLACDLGIFNQALYSSLNYGLLLYNTVELGTHFQFHFDPILFLLLPFYSFYQSPLLLLAIQSIVLGLGAVPAFLLSRDVLKSDLLAFLLSLCYLLNPSIHGVNLYDFHPDCFFPLLFLSSLLFLERRRLLKSAFCMILSLMCKEVAAFTVALLGLYALWLYRKEIRWSPLLNLKVKEVLSNRYFAFALATITLGFSWFILSSILFPAITSANRHAFSWSYLGVGIGGVVKSLLTNPIGSLQMGLNPNPVKLVMLKVLYGKYLTDQVILALALIEPSMKATYVLQLFAPFAFLPFLSPAALLPAVPWFLLNLLSVTPTHYVAVGYHYPALSLPFIFAASVYGLRNIITVTRKAASTVSLPQLVKAAFRGSHVSLCLALIVLGCSFAGFYVWSPLWLVHPPSPRSQVLAAVVQSIPPYSMIATQSNLFPHFTPTMNLYLGHYTFMPESYDYVIADVYSPWYYLSGCSGLSIFYERLTLNELVPELLASGNYTVLFQFNGVLVIGRS